ncbi:hypothetical protein [Bellilinea sp.]|jgi:hypothetical protein
MANLFILDIDGVLVKPGGYRTALHRTIAHFLEQLGLPDSFNLTEEEIGTFEANGITSEWDMIPLTFAILFDKALSNAKIHLPSLKQAIEWFRKTHPLVERPSYVENIAEWLGMAIPSLPLADALFSRLQQNPDNHPFRNLAGQPFTVEVLGNTRDFSANPFSRLFQNQVLGKALFAQYYPNLPVVQVESTLERYDEPNLEPTLQQELREQIKNGQIRAAAMTLRPNWVENISINGNSCRAGFSPEAEIALNLSGLEGIPLAGYGTLLWACERYHLAIDQILKPSEFHALTAILMTFTDITNALHLTMRLYQPAQGNFPEGSPFSLGDFLPDEPLHIHVFEDSPNGIRSVIRASEILKNAGWPVWLNLWGITDHPHKKKALQDLGAKVFGNVNEALATALEMNRN